MPALRDEPEQSLTFSSRILSMSGAACGADDDAMARVGSRPAPGCVSRPL